MKFRLSLLAAGLLVVSALPEARAHITLRVPMPRTTATTGQKGPPPCGNMGPAKPNEYRPGQSIMVEWTETIPHPGRFRIAFGPQGTAFPNPMTQKDTNTTLPIFLDGLFPKTGNGGGGMHAQMITFPSTPCDACTLQVIQVMKVNPPYAAGADQDIYYQCADIVLKGEPMGGKDGGAADGATGTDAGGTGGSGGSGGSGGAGGAGGSGGVGGSGGSGGAGGSTGGAGGSSGGSSGSTTGGSTGSGGSGTGGSGSGGSGSSGRGGSGGSGTGGSGTTTPPPKASSPLGCSVGSGQPSLVGLGFAALVMGLALRGRRRRR